MPLEPHSKDNAPGAAFGLRRGSVSLGQERLSSAWGRARAGLDLPPLVHLPRNIHNQWINNSLYNVIKGNPLFEVKA